MTSTTRGHSGPLYAILARPNAGTAGTSPFVTSVNADELPATFGAGLDLFAANGTTLRASYGLEAEEHSRAHTLGLKASIAFQVWNLARLSFRPA